MPGRRVKQLLHHEIVELLWDLGRIMKAYPSPVTVLQQLLPSGPVRSSRSVHILKLEILLALFHIQYCRILSVMFG